MGGSELIEWLAFAAYFPTPAEKTELWDRWKRGESLKAIGRAFGKESSSNYFLPARVLTEALPHHTRHSSDRQLFCRALVDLL
jgi:hypothetical protein